MDPQTAAKVLQLLQTTGIAALVFAACALWPTIQRTLQLAKIPNMSEFGTGEKYRQTYLSSARKIYEKGYAKFKDCCYALVNEDGVPTVIIPPSLLPELRKLPDDVVDFQEAVKGLMEVAHTHLDTGSTTSITTIKANLTPALTRLNPTICNEVDAALRQGMPPCEDWTQVNIYEKLVLLVAKVSGRIFVGPEACQDPEYLDTACNYTLDLMNAVSALKRMRPWVKHYFGSRTPEVIKLRQREKLAEKVLRPLIEERINSKANDPNWQEPDDLMQWMLNRSNGNDSIEQLVGYQLSIIFGAIHTTTVTATNILYTLATTPEYIEPLREEIRTVLANHDGTITSRALQQMEKLDSYMKEVMRFNPPLMTSFTRYAKKGFSLSNGQYIPQGVMIEVPSFAIYRDETFYPSADRFDGYRSYKQRASGKAQDIARNQFVTTNETNLAFGYGRHACPGRFFATNEIKMVLARLLLQYDIKMPNGETERYPQIEHGKQCGPDATKMLAFKRVEV